MRVILILALIVLIGCKNENDVDISKRQNSLQNREVELIKLDGTRIDSLELSNQIERLIKAANVTGITVSIFNDNEAIYTEAFGYSNKKDSTYLSTDQIIYGASFSKAVFGYLMSQLVSEGVFDLDKPLQEYLEKPLPEYKLSKEWRSYKNLKGDKRYEEITGRMCLTHTTGFPNWRFFTKNFDFDREGKIRFIIDPGTRYSYSGEGIYLLQFVIEKITGQNLEDMAQERIFSPLGMDMTSYVWQDRFEDVYCNGHTTTEEVIKKDIEDEANAAGSMETTIVDYSKFIKEILKQTENGSEVTNLLFQENKRIKSKVQFGVESWDDTDENDDIKLNYGLGWGLLHSPFGKAAFKEGHGEGFQHYSIVFLEKGIGIIIMSNSDNAESIFKELLEISIGDVYTPWKWERYIPYDLDY